MTASPSTDGTDRLTDAIGREYGRRVLSIDRIERGMGTTNWKVRTAEGEYFLKQYPSGADLPGEAAALEMSQLAQAAGVPTPSILPSRSGELLWSGGELAFALFEYLADATSGLALSGAQMAEAGKVLGWVHQRLRRVRSSFPDITENWLALNEERKCAEFERYLAVIARREEPDDFDRRSALLVRSRLEMLPRAVAVLRTLPGLSRQVLHGDYSVWNVLFHGSEVAGVVDFRPPELFLPSFEIGRAALNPETVTAGPWLDKARAFVEAYCRSNPEIAADDVRFAPHVWGIHLVRSEYGLKQHYFRPLDQQDVLDRFWFQRCETAEVIFDNLDEISECFVAAWERCRREP